MTFYWTSISCEKTASILSLLELVFKISCFSGCGYIRIGTDVNVAYKFLKYVSYFKICLSHLSVYKNFCLGSVKLWKEWPIFESPFTKRMKTILYKPKKFLNSCISVVRAQFSTENIFLGLSIDLRRYDIWYVIHFITGQIILKRI